MWTGVQVDVLDVVSIHLGEEGLNLQHTPGRIRSAIQSLNWGKPSDSKDFLDQSKTMRFVITRRTGVRKRAANIYLIKLPHELQDAIKQGS